MDTTFVIITGASKGIGRSIALSFAQHSEIKKLHLCLMARSQDGLNETSRLILDKKEHSPMMCTKEIVVTTHPIDLSDLDSLEESIVDIFKQCYEPYLDQYTHCILINNAGTLGHLGQAISLPSPKDLMQNVELNLASSCWLSSYFIRDFHLTRLYRQNKKCTVVNMSSLCAISPFETMAMYCAGKAYRDMYHQTMALEQLKRSDDIKILNYAPGAIATDMTDTLRNCHDLDPELQTFFNSRDENKFVKVEDSTSKLVQLVLSGNFESGKHIDYWDDIE